VASRRRPSNSEAGRGGAGGDAATAVPSVSEPIRMSDSAPRQRHAASLPSLAPAGAREGSRGGAGAAPRTRPAAARLLRERLDASSRVLVLGAGGWFGSTALDLLADAATGAQLLALTGRPRWSVVNGRRWRLSGWDTGAVVRFAPTHVVNCAFLTRDLVASRSRERYISDNVKLSARFLQTLELPSLRAAVTVSSGAALAATAGLPELETEPYGYLKRVEELLAHAVAAERAVPVTVCRAWSVTGPFVTRPREYAFSDLVAQAGEGSLRLRSAHQVWRRYVGVDELLGVALALAHDGSSGTLESGGPLVELGELALLVAHELAVEERVERPAPNGQPADHYHSDGSSWREACRRLGYLPATLEEQIRGVADALLADRSALRGRSKLTHSGKAAA